MAGTPPTYTTNGSGYGVNYYYDCVGYASSPTCGPIEIEGKLTSQSSTTAGALSALMIRESFDENTAMAAIGVTYTGTGTGTVNFYYRPNNSYATTVAGSSVTLPIYLRLVNNGTTISGYSSTDNETWTLVGSTTSVSLPKMYYVGMASANASNSSGPNNATVFSGIIYDTSLPSTTNMMLWLRSNVGVVSSSGSVSQWNDQSGLGNNATQSTGTLQPALTTGAINSGVLPALTFNGTSQFMNLPSGFANLTNGYSAFVVLEPTSSSATGVPCVVGNAANSDAVFPETIGKNAALYAFNGSTSSNVTTTTTPLSNTSYQLLEETLLPGATAGTATGTIFVNGTQIKQSTDHAKS